MWWERAHRTSHGEEPLTSFKLLTTIADILFRLAMLGAEEFGSKLLWNFDSTTSYSGMNQTPAIARTPIEIWETILEEVIRPGVALDTSCTLESFREFRRRGGDGYTESEKQRLVLRRVCKKWKTFAEGRAHRRMDSKSPLGLLPPSTVLHATRVHYTTEHFSKYLTQNTRWKIVRVDITDKEPNLLHDLAENAGSHPHIRRLVLDLEFNNHGTIHIADFTRFRQLTYLLIRRHRDPSPVSWGKPASPITLPHLEVLDFQCDGSRTSFPSESVHLPSLRHLSLWVRNSTLLVDTITPYASTLRSLMVRHYYKTSSLPPQLFTLLPNVEELAVNASVTADDYPPSNHPLKRFIVLSQVIQFSEILKLIERLPPVRLIFSKLEWPTSTQKGQALRIKLNDGGDTLDKMKQLAALCESKSIRLEDDNGRTLTEAEVTDTTKADDIPMCSGTAE